ncbi:hypothetical protein [Streptomyces subrutilus]|nr:hypothetical protein [Streptomyces subrutilus]
MRPLTAPDWPGGLDGLIQARHDHQNARRHAVSGDGAALVDLVRLESVPAVVPVGMCDYDTLVAAFALRMEDPLIGWPDAERAEPSLVVSYAHTHPRHRRLFRLITPWLCDYAARRPAPPRWVRGSVGTSAVAEHLRNCGWQSVQQAPAPGRPRHLVQCAPQQNDIRTLIRSEGELAPPGGTVRRSRTPRSSN